MSTLVADVTRVQTLLQKNQPSADKECELKRKWASYGADMTTIKLTPFRAPAGQTASVTLGAMFMAGSVTYVIVGWFISYNYNTADDAVVPYQVSCLLLVEGSRKVVGTMSTGHWMRVA
jgi:predicted cupin superfamily sugar epimerase